MLTKVSSKGQTVIPAAIREMARVKAGDELEVGVSGGMIILRKRRPLTPERIRALLLAGRQLPELTPEAGRSVARALDRVRRRPSR